jgi:hypothetical protein
VDVVMEPELPGGSGILKCDRRPLLDQAWWRDLGACEAGTTSRAD